MTEQCPVSTTASIAQEPVEFPPGLLGRVAQYIFDSAPYPNKQVALAGSLALLAGISGRAFNVSGTGLNIYIALIGSTAIGKEAAQSGISQLLRAVAVGLPAALDFVGPSYFASGQALHKRLARTPSLIAPIGELGIKLASWGKVGANPASALWLALLLDVFGKSGGNQMLQGAEYSDKANNVPAINSPCLTLLGDSTPETWYAAFNPQLVSNGLAGRFITINAGSQQGEFSPSRLVEVPKDLADDLTTFCAGCLSATKPVDVELDDDAKAGSTDLRQAVRKKINSLDDEIARHLFGRVHLNVLKIAALVAVGRAPIGSTPIISIDDLAWASRVVCAGVDTTAHRVASGNIGEVAGDENKQLNAIMSEIKSYINRPFNDETDPKFGVNFDMHRDRVITQTYLSRKLLKKPAFKGNLSVGGTGALHKSLKALVDADILRPIPKPLMQKYGTLAVAFIVTYSISLTEGNE